MVLKHKRPLKQQSQNIKNTNFNSTIDTEIPLKVRLFLSPQIVNIKYKGDIFQMRELMCLN